MSPKKLSNKKVLLLVENLYDEMELNYPLYRLKEEGAEVIIAGPKAKEIYKSKHGMPCEAEISFQDVKEHEFDAMVIPGGYAPDKLRRDPKVLELVQKFNQKEKPIAFICHAGWVPISAKVINDVRCTSTAAIKDDLINAGARWVDEPVVIDRHFISSRTPADLPDFCQAIIQALITRKPRKTAMV
jgi:protease I